MATNDIKRLYQGQLPSTVGTLYTAPNGAASDRAMIKEMMLHNNGGSSETIQLYVTGTTDADKILDVTLSAGESGQFNGTIVLNNGETFSGVTTTASTVTLTVFGMEMT